MADIDNAGVFLQANLKGITKDIQSSPLALALDSQVTRPTSMLSLVPPIPDRPKVYTKEPSKKSGIVLSDLENLILALTPDSTDRGKLYQALKIHELRVVKKAVEDTKAHSAQLSSEERAFRTGTTQSLTSLSEGMTELTTLLQGVRTEYLEAKASLPTETVVELTERELSNAVYEGTTLATGILQHLHGDVTKYIRVMSSKTARELISGFWIDNERTIIPERITLIYQKYFK